MVRVNRSFTLISAAHIANVPAVNRAVMKQVLQQTRAIETSVVTTGCKSSDNSACMLGKHSSTEFRGKPGKEQHTQWGV